MSRLIKSFSRGSGNGGQNLHASHSRCLVRFNINTADWIPLAVRNSFIERFGEFVSPRGAVVIVREDTRSPSDNEKLAIRQLQDMLDKAENLSTIDRGSEEFANEVEKIKAGKTKGEIERYKDRAIGEKKQRSLVKQSRRGWD